MQPEFLQNNPLRQWLIQKIYVNDWIFLDRWSLVHFASAALIAWILSKYMRGYQFFIAVFAILFAWELWENFSGQPFFGTEPRIDMVWDMIIGMLAASLVYIIKSRQ